MMVPITIAARRSGCWPSPTGLDPLGSLTPKAALEVAK